jgi:predicted nucleic acid-binding protein
LLVNDSILLAVMLDQGLTDLVTQDSDFETVPGITVWKPIL